MQFTQSSNPIPGFTFFVPFFVPTGLPANINVRGVDRALPLMHGVAFHADLNQRFHGHVGLVVAVDPSVAFELFQPCAEIFRQVVGVRIYN